MEYQDWNSALATHFLHGVAYGSRIYLSVDDAVLEAIGQAEFETDPLNGLWREDFIEAVRRQVVTGRNYNRTSFNRIEICCISKSVN